MQVGVRVVGRAGDGGASDAVASGDLSALRAALAGGDDGGPALGTEGLGTVDVEAVNLVNVRSNVVCECLCVRVCVCVCRCKRSCGENDAARCRRWGSTCWGQWRWRAAGRRRARGT